MPRTKEDNEKIQARRREKILQAALDVFSRKGLGASKIEEIAGEAGMSRGLLYHYYRSKEEVYSALIANAYERMAEAARSLEALPVTAKEKIRRALKELLANVAESGKFARSVMLISRASSDESVPEEVRNMGSDLGRIPYDVMEGIFRQGQREGSVPEGDPRELSLLFWVTIKGLGMHKVSMGKKYIGPDPVILERLFLKQGV
ncbi:MAG: TetR/AcrR family transcriptional regulator [Spirochaetales bacterium]|nr:TetR/AcrR family transcriptional regulator [Spirochaetales bacterium]